MNAQPGPPDPPPEGRGILAPVLLYAVFAALWILVSDQVVTRLFSDPHHVALANTLKGWLFVAVTALLFYSFLRHRLPAWSMPPARPRTQARLSWPFLGILLAIAGITAAGILHTFGHQRDVAVSRLQAIADLKTRQISDWLGERRGDAEFVQSSVYFAEQYLRWTREGSAEAAQRLRVRLDQLRRNRGFGAISLLDADSRRLWSSDQTPRQSAPALQEAVAQSWDGQVRRVGPYAGPDGRTHLDYVVPLVLAGSPPPVVVLHVDPAEWLYPVLQSWPVPSASGETLLFRRDGMDVLYLNELRHRKDTAGKFRLSLDNRELLVSRAVLGTARQGEAMQGRDYRGTPVMGVSRAIPDTDWYLVAKQDQSELYVQARRDALWMGLAGALALLIALASLVVLRQRNRLAMAEHARAAEAERLRALKLLEAFAESSDDAIFAKDTEGRYILFNRAASRFVGRPAREVLGRDDRALFPPEQAEMLMAMDREAIRRNGIHTEVEVLDTPMGRRTFLATKGPLRDEHDRVIGTFGMSRDVTESRRAEEVLAEQMQRFRLLLDASRDGIVIIDQDHRIIEANQRFADMLGYPMEELRQLRSWDYDVLHDEAAIRAGFADLSQVNRVFETRHRRRDGGEYDVEISASGAVWGGQKLVLCICRDISARKRAQAQIDLWATAFEQAGFGLAIGDAVTGCFQAVNPTFARERGYTPAELTGRPIMSVYPADRRDEMAARLADLDAAGHGVFESEHVRRDGSRFPVLMDVTVIRAADGSPARRVAYALDITERKRAEAAIRESEARFRALVEQSLAGIYIIQDGYFRYVNPGFATIFGYGSPADIVDRVPFAELVAPEDRERVAENIRRRIDGEITDIHYVFRGLRRDGAPIDVEVHGRVLDHAGGPAVIGMILDITARKAAEDALRQSELRFHDIVNASADWVWEVDADGVYTYASESVHDLLGYTAAEIVGRTPFDLMPPGEAERIRERFTAFAAGKVPFRDLENVNLHKDGSLRHVLTNGMPILDEAGNLLGYRGLDRDATERKQAEIALRESEARWIMAIDSAGHGVWDWNAATDRVYFSPAWKAMLGHAVDEIGDSLEEWTRRVHPDDLARCQTALERHFRGETDTYVCEHRLRCKDGDYKWILDQGRVVSRDAAGKPLRVIGTHTDITLTKAAEEELRLKGEELAQRNAELERFNKVMVGRELVMIDLKRQVNALARRLGEEPPYPLKFDAGEDDADVGGEAR